MRRHFSFLWQSFLHVIYPPSCPLCDGGIDKPHVACADCHAALHMLDGDFTAPRLDRVWFRRARSVLAYEGSVARAVWGLKYEKRFDLVPFFVDLLVKHLPHPQEYDVIVPVPLDGHRLGERGYNQSALLAARLGKRLELSIDISTLVRIRPTPPQVGQDAATRIHNVRDAFAVPEKKRHRVRGRRVLLIDDVITTGATVNECARELMKTGVVFVDVLTIARPL